MQRDVVWFLDAVVAGCAVLEVTPYGVKMAWQMEVGVSAEKPMKSAVDAMATEMEYRVAEAMYSDANPNGPSFGDYVGIDLWLKSARAAIRAMREPTEEMVDMGGRGIARDTQYFGGAMTLARYSSHEVEAQNRLRADAAWAAMIGAATPPIQESPTAAVPQGQGSRQSP